MTLGRSPEKQTLGKKNLEQSGFSFKKNTEAQVNI